MKKIISTLEDDMSKIFCGGAFCFDYRKNGYEIMAAKDYRARLLDYVELLLCLRIQTE